MRRVLLLRLLLAVGVACTHVVQLHKVGEAFLPKMHVPLLRGNTGHRGALHSLAAPHVPVRMLHPHFLSPVRFALPLMRAEPLMDDEPLMGDNSLIGAGLRQVSSFGSEVINIEPGDSALLVGVDIKRNRYRNLRDSWTVEDSLDELERLCETAGLEVRGRVSQAMERPSPTFVGSGKLEEIAERIENLGVTTVVFDDELSVGQGRRLQKKLGEDVQVLDRTILIIQIFAQRARTREAQLQVQAAQMEYMLPRLNEFLTEGAGLDSKGGSQKGRTGTGGYLKGMGESQLEVDRRLFRGQLARIKAEIDEVRSRREIYREKRRESDILPVVALVGYTNSGKSTLLNTLSGKAEVYADDLLFATLDPTTRRLDLPGGKEVLLIDTVGFIQKLPTKLIASFSATLDVLEDAAIVVHVVDSSSPLAPQQVQSVQRIIVELGVEDTPQILLLNKADAVAADPDAAQRVKETDWKNLTGAVMPTHVLEASGREGRGLEKLLAAVEDSLLSMTSKVDCVLPYREAALLALVHETGTIEREEYLKDGTRLVAYVPASLRNRLAKACASAGSMFLDA